MNTHKIYTRSGDRGQTSLIGGRRVPKHHLRIEAYGTIDELNSFIGLLRDHDIAAHYKEVLLKIQHHLFIAESLLASEAENESLPCLNQNDIELLENEIDAMNAELPLLENFILPGGVITVSYAHVARCVCRRAERIITGLNEKSPLPDVLIQYINRLSDYLFVLARKLALDAGIGDVVWKAEKCR